MSRPTYIAGGTAVLIFILSQIFQQWVFANYPLGIDSVSQLSTLGQSSHIARSTAVLLSIISLMFPFTVISFQAKDQIVRTLIIVFFSFFVLLEVSYRSVELFVVQLSWSQQAGDPSVVDRFDLFQEVKSAVYFPLLMSHGIASALAAWTIPFRGADRWLKFALGMNAIRLVLRTLGMFVGIGWMNWLTGTNYFWFMLIVFLPLMTWFFLRSRSYVYPISESANT